MRLHRDYHHVRRLVMQGVLAGGRDEFGRLYADEASVDQFRRQAETATTTAASNALPTGIPGNTAEAVD
jgi:hypothetical protein